jgi:uncharacterized protein YcbK (DUF882 family)
MQNLHRRFQERRGVLKWLAMGPVALSLGLRQQLAVADALAVERVAVAPRELSLHNLHTGEQLALRYFDDGQYLPQALTQFNRLLRDHRSGEVAPIDQRLLDQLHALAVGARREPHYQIISGYRSPQSNAALRAGTEGVAQRSLHMEGRALDVRLTGTRCSRLRDLALGLRQGGVGYYAKSDFVHLDTGRVRGWAG